MTAVSLPPASSGEVSRNFRTLYYDHLGLRNPDQEDQIKALEKLLNEEPINKDELITFTRQFPIPALMRPFVWKVLLDVSPLHKESMEFVAKHRKGQYEDLKQALVTMRMISDAKEDKDSELVVLMFLLDNGMLSILHKNVLKRDGHKVFVLESLSKAVCEIINDECDTFWITKKLYMHQETFFDSFVQLPKFIKYYLQLEDQRLFEHLCEIQLFKVLPYNRWFQTYFACVFYKSLEYLGRIWDKLISGSCNILVFVCVAMLLIFSIKLKELRSSECALRLISDVSEDIGYAIIDKAMELYDQYQRSLDMELGCE